MLVLSRASLVVMLSGLTACAAAPAPAAAEPATTSAAPSASAAPAPTAADASSQCGRALPAAQAAAKEGDACGGTTHVACAEGLTCFATYRCPESVGTCKKR